MENRVNISPQDAVGIYSAFLFRNDIGKTDANKWIYIFEIDSIQRYSEGVRR